MDWHHSQSIIKLCLEELKVNTCCPEFMTTLHLVINNGNWTNWSAMWYEIIWLISKSVQVGLKSQVWFQTKIAWHEVQLPLYYSHFEITEFIQYQYLFDLIAVLLKSGNKKAFASHFLHETKMMQYRAKMVRLKFEMTTPFRKIVWFVTKSHS